MLAPSIEVLTLSRLAQGFGGAAGVVLARAVITDRAHGVGAAKLFSFMMIVAVVSPRWWRHYWGARSSGSSDGAVSSGF